MLAPTPCLDNPCPLPAIRGGRCKDHQRPPWLGSLRKLDLPTDWRTRRLIVLKRDKGICYLCGDPNADTVDHIKAGNDHSLNNLAAVHDRVAPHCHRYKTSQEGHAGKR